MGQLDFFEIVNAYRIGVALSRKEDLHEISNDGKFHGLLLSLEIQHGKPTVGHILGFSARDKKGVKNPLRHLGEGKMFEGTPF